MKPKNLQDKLIIFIYSFFTSLGYSLMLYSIRNFGYMDVYYSYFLALMNVGILFASLFYGYVEINEKNYISYNFIGIIAILISFFFLYYAENFFYLLLSVFFMYFIGSSVSFILIRFRKDVKLYYYFTLYGLFGFFVAQIFLFLNLDFKNIVVLSFITAFVFFIFTFSFYLKKVFKTVFRYFLEEYGLLATTEKVLMKMEDTLFKFVGKPSRISLINFVTVVLYTIYWTALLTISAQYNTYFPIFLFLNNLSLAITYNILPKNEKIKEIFFKSLYGIVLRFIGVISLLLILEKSIYNLLILFLFYILAAVSWGIFSFYMDDYILKKKESEYGFVSFFRNFASVCGSIFVGIMGIKPSLLFSIFLFFLILVLYLFLEKIYNGDN